MVAQKFRHYFPDIKVAMPPKSEGFKISGDENDVRQVIDLIQRTVESLAVEYVVVPKKNWWERSLVYKEDESSPMRCIMLWTLGWRSFLTLGISNP